MYITRMSLHDMPPAIVVENASKLRLKVKAAAQGESRTPVLERSGAPVTTRIDDVTGALHISTPDNDSGGDREESHDRPDPIIARCTVIIPSATKLGGLRVSAVVDTGVALEGTTGRSPQGLVVGRVALSLQATPEATHGTTSSIHMRNVRIGELAAHTLGRGNVELFSVHFGEQEDDPTSQFVWHNESVIRTAGELSGPYDTHQVMLPCNDSRNEVCPGVLATIAAFDQQL